MNQVADSLVRQCTQATHDGVEFPAIWDSILKEHCLVVGRPVEAFEDELPYLDVRLRNGFWLRFCVRSNDFSLRRAMLHRSF